MIVALLAVVLVITGLLHWYLWKRLVRDTTRTRRGRRIGTVVAVVLALVIPATLALSRTLPHSGQALVAWPGFLWLALMFYLLVTLLLLEIPRLAIRLWQRRLAPSSAPTAAFAAASTPSSAAASSAVADEQAVAFVHANVGDKCDEPPTAASAGNQAAAAGVAAGNQAAAADEQAVAFVLANVGDECDEPPTAASVGNQAAAADEQAAAADEQAVAFVHAEAEDKCDEAPAAGRDDERFDAGRRLLLGRSLAVTAGLLSVSAVGIGAKQALGAPNLKHVPIRLAKLPASMDGFRIALVSDIHLGPLLGRAHTERIVRMINSVDADLVAVVGDLVDGSVAELGPAAEPLQDLRAKHGSFFVTGNHEYFSGYREWVDEVNSLGVRVLRNERVDVLGLDLAGVNDATGASAGDAPDYAKALDGRDAARPVVLLAHQPVQAHEAAERGVDLQLSGHTHGGQMVPFNLLVGLQQPVVAGLGQVGGTQVYVTRGAGFWGPPVRFGAPPDISVVELHGA